MSPLSPFTVTPRHPQPHWYEFADFSSPTTGFDKLHAVLQIAFGWAECHMHTFRIQKPGADNLRPSIMSLSRYPMTDIEDMNDKPETEWTLADVYEKPEWKDKVQITYEYDMG